MDTTQEGSTLDVSVYGGDVAHPSQSNVIFLNKPFVSSIG